MEKKKNPRWKQDTPRMQLTAIYQAILGDMSNMSEEIGNPKLQTQRILSLMEELRDLIPFLPEGVWEALPVQVNFVRCEDCKGTGSGPANCIGGFCTLCQGDGYVSSV